MLKANKHVTKVVAGTVATSILAHSCIPYGDMNDNDDFLYNSNIQRSHLGNHAVSMRFDLSSDQASYLGFIQKLSHDIVKNPVIAKQFYNNPKSFLERYGYKGEINFDDDLLQLILALGDDDLNKAIKVGDAKLFLDLCYEKGLLKSDSEIQASLGKQYAKQLADLGLNLPPLEELQAGVGFALLITVCIALIIIVNVTITWDIQDDVTGPGGEFARNTVKQYISENNPALNIWFLKQKKDKTFILVDKYTELHLDKLISEIKSRNPVYFDNISESEFKNLLKLNTIMPN